MYNPDIASKYKYKPLGGLFEVLPSKINGQGLFVKPEIVIQKGNSHIITHIEVYGSDFKHFFRTPVGGFLNHSDKPNCELVKVIPEGLPYNYYELVVLREINGGEEVTVDYNNEKICIYDI